MKPDTTTAKDRVWALTYGDERDDVFYRISIELASAKLEIAAEWQRDKDELARLRKEIQDAPCQNQGYRGMTEREPCQCSVCKWKRNALGE